MPAVATRIFSFICGQDDFLVGRMGRKRFEELSGEATDEFSREIIMASLNVDKAALSRLISIATRVPPGFTWPTGTLTSRIPFS